MRLRRRIASALMVAAASAAASALVLAAAPLERFGWFGDLAGSCWTAMLPGGDSRHTHCYTSQFGHFIRGTATLTPAQQREPETEFEGDSVFAWNEQAQRIDYYIWGSDGNYGQQQAYYEGDDLMFPVPSRSDPGNVAFRSVWRRIDADTLEVRREVPDAGGWRTEMTVSYAKSALPE